MQENQALPDADLKNSPWIQKEERYVGEADPETPAVLDLLSLRFLSLLLFGCSHFSPAYLHTSPHSGPPESLPL